MPYVLGEATVTIHQDGHREVTTANLRVELGDKPRTLEASGSDPIVWARIRAGVPGTYETVAHFGGATALLVLRRAIALPDLDFLGPMEANFGALGEEMLLGAVRTGAAAATQFCVDTCGGMFMTLDWELESLISMLKILPFKMDGWVRILLPAGFAQYQGAFDEAQRQRWAVANSGFESNKDAAWINFLPFGQDRFNGEPTLVVFGPLGDCQFIRVARLKLEGDGFLFRDGEWRTGQRVINQRRPDMVPFHDETVPTLVPLHRQIVATTTVANHPGKPLILQLHPDGHLHQGGLHVFVDGLNQRLLSHNPARVLGPHGLGWLAEK